MIIMDKMIVHMDPAEKERMMLAMVPMMMKDVDMTDVMAKMIPEMLSRIPVATDSAAPPL